MEENKPVITNTSEKSSQVPEESGKRSYTLLLALGVVVIIIVMVTIVLSVNKPSETITSTTEKATNTSQINSLEDLDKVSGELDTEDLDTYESELEANEEDLNSF